MNFEQMKELITIEFIDDKLMIDGEEFSRELIEKNAYARIWNSATVVKNKRQADKGGVKATVLQAINEGLIEKEEGFDLVMTPDKEKIAELKEKLPTVEKTVEPTEDDIKRGKEQVQAGKGQRA